MAKRTCSVEGCEKPHQARGWCMMHYGRWHRTGDPLDRGSMIVNDPVARFEAFTDKTETCWLWTKRLSAGGYGYINIGKRKVLVHRWSYEHHVGPIPEGLTIDHLCRVRNCVRPDHLEPVTMRENTMRGTAPSARHAVATHCKWGHPFDEANTYINPANGWRYCRTCGRERARERREG